MSKYELMYEVTDKEGVSFCDGGSNGGAVERLPLGAKISQGDIDRGCFTLGGLENLESKGRVKKLTKSTKIAPKQSTKDVK